MSKSTSSFKSLDSRTVGMWFNREILEDASWDAKITQSDTQELADLIEAHYNEKGEGVLPEGNDTEIEWYIIASFLHTMYGV